MGKLKNEQGYALVTVLLIIVIFSVLFLSLSSQSFSNMKQNQVTEKSSQSVALAEMGINYYKTFIQKVYEDQQINVSAIVQQSLQQNDNTENIKSLASSAMSNAIQQQVSSMSPVHHPVAENPSATFTLTSFTPAVSQNKITLTFTVLGTVNGPDKGKTLTAVITIDLSKIVPNIKPVQPFDKVQNQQFSVCSDIQNCSPVFGNGLNITGNANNLNGQTIYSTDFLNIDGNANNSNTKIHSEGLLTIGKNMNHLTDSIVETNDSATFNQNLTIDSSKSVLSALNPLPSYFLVYKDLTINNHLTLNDITYTYVGRNASIDDLDISSLSKMCVQGNLTVNKDFTKKVATGNLMVYGSVTDNGSSISGYTVTAGSFISRCGSIIPLQLSIDWGNLNNVVVTSVKYN